RERNVGQRNAFFEGTFGAHYVAIVHIHHAVALRAAGSHHVGVAVGAKVDHLAQANISHGGDVGVHGVEHGVAGRGHVLHDHALQDHHVFDGGDEVQAQMVAFAHIGHHCHLAAVKTQTFAQDAA